MPVLTVRHVTTYRYRQPVAFGEHRMMFWPREGHDQRLLESRLTVTPTPSSVRTIHDVFGNTVGVARFSGRSQELCFDSFMRIEHRPADIGDFAIDEHASVFPFSYSAEDMPDLLRSIERQHPDPAHELERWARQFVGGKTRDVLTGMTQAVRSGFAYVARPEAGVQDPLRTLRVRSGTCRDFAVLMIEALRTLGFAARFVSGYLFAHGADGRGHAGGGATHAWVRVYLPGAGWIDFDPTNGIAGNRDLIRVAVARDPRQAVPLHGTWTGFPADSLGMHVDVSVTRAEPAATEALRTATA